MSSSKVYTRTGDQGTTSLFGGARVVKDDPRLEAYGTLDELDSVVGLLLSDIETEKWPGSAVPEAVRLRHELLGIQATLFVLGSHLATEFSADGDGVRAKLPVLTPDVVAGFEVAMDRMSTDLAPLKHFILPGGVRPAATAHIARTVARRAERAIVHFAQGHAADAKSPKPEWLDHVLRTINRLNDYFFVLARHLNRLAGREEPVWIP